MKIIYQTFSEERLLVFPGLLPVKNKMGPFEGPFHVHLIFSLLKRVNFSLRWFFFR